MNSKTEIAPAAMRGSSRAGRNETGMGSRIQTFDWAQTPLGPIEGWPQSLRTVVDILLSSRYAMWMAWGPELTFLFNDAYSPTLGLKVAWALGAPAQKVWAEIWPDIGPRIDSVLADGKATYDEGLLLFLQRSGFPEETYHTFSYSPLRDDAGRISGMLCVVTEETNRIIGERRVGTLRDLGSALANAKQESEVLQALSDELDRNRKDLPFTLTYLFRDDGSAELGAASGIQGGHPLAPARLEPGAQLPWPAGDAFLHGEPRLLEDLSAQRAIAALPSNEWTKSVEQVAIVRFKQQGQELPAGFLIAGINPYRRYDDAYSGFLDLLAGQIGSALANARAYEAEQRRAEALAEIDRAKTTFFSNVSHELRTPLTLMLSPVEELLGDGRMRANPEHWNLLDLVHRNALRLQRLVNTLLDFSRIEAGRMQAIYEQVDLPALTSDLASSFRSAMERAGLAFHVECDEQLPAPVCVDREMWEKIVLNLLSNALKFTMQGSVTVRVRAGYDHAELQVRDTGTGIPASELPHIFERFHRVAGASGRTIEGTGIGLALVQELVKLHGGSIGVESVLGAGTTFTVRIPFGTAHLPKDRLQTARDVSATAPRPEAFLDEAERWMVSQASEHAPEQVAGSQERVLLADDNADIREYVTKLLSRNYQVTAVPSGDAALQAALADPPDLILSDVMMPGLDGFGLLQELRARPETSTIPVVLLSARAGEESRVEGLGAGADDYLIKPFTARELLARVGAHLAMHRRWKEAENALKRSQATLQSFYDSSPLLMGVAEVAGEEIIPVYGNRATAIFYGLDPEALAPPNIESARIPRPADRLWLAKYLESQRNGRPVHFEYGHTSDAGTAWLRATVNYLGEGVTGRPRFSFVAEDITERKRQDELLRRSNDDLRRANAELEQFAYSASHDLQEPLRQVAIYSQLLNRRFGGKLDGEASDYLEFCVEGAHRMGMLITDLLSYSQAAKTSDEPLGMVDTNEVLEDVKKNLFTTIRESNAQISSEKLPAVFADRAALTHVFQNLISNAIKYRSDEAPRVSIRAEHSPGEWRFAVEDNGIGIPGQFHQQIFGIFKRLHDRNRYAGTGIGLAICQKVVERYGGRIWVESEEGSGSTFFFTLPDRAEVSHSIG